MIMATPYGSSYKATYKGKEYGYTIKEWALILNMSPSFVSNKIRIARDKGHGRPAEYLVLEATSIIKRRREAYVRSKGRLSTARVIGEEERYVHGNRHLFDLFLLPKSATLTLKMEG